MQILSVMQQYCDSRELANEKKADIWIKLDESGWEKCSNDVLFMRFLKKMSFLLEPAYEKGVVLKKYKIS